MTRTQIITATRDGSCFRRSTWEFQKKVRAAHEGDRDYIGVIEVKDIFVEDCVKPMDCSIRIWVPEEEDKNADDYEIVNCNSKN